MTITPAQARAYRALIARLLSAPLPLFPRAREESALTQFQKMAVIPRAGKQRAPFSLPQIGGSP